MSKTTNYYNKVITALQELHTLYPNYNMGRHLVTALDGYGDTWGLTDKELLYALTKYKGELEMDVPHTDDTEIDQIIKDGMNLDNLFKEEDNDGEY